MKGQCCIILISIILLSCVNEKDFDDKVVENLPPEVFISSMNESYQIGDTMHLHAIVVDIHHNIAKITAKIEFPTMKWEITNISGNDYIFNEYVIIPNTSAFGDYRFSVTAIDDEGLSGGNSRIYKILP